MDRKRPPPSARIPRSSSSASASQTPRINTVHDIPPELREMLASNIRESRANNSSGSGSNNRIQETSSETPKRKKPLTRRAVGATTTSIPTISSAASAAAVKAPVDGGLNSGEIGSKTSSSAAAGGGQSQLSEGKAGSKENTKSVASPAKVSVTTVPAPTQKASALVQDSESEYDEDDDDDDDEFGDDDEIEWETVDLSTLKKNTPNPLSTPSEPLILTLTTPFKPSKQKSSTAKKPPTPAERKIRLEVHKLHLLCLISHLHLRSTFCNDPKSQSSLLPILEKRIISELNDTSFQQSKIFKQGLSNAAAAFKRRYKITKPGARKALWGYTPPSFDSMWGDIPIGIDEFRSSAKKLSGSRDLGTQLFCALLRRMGLDARIVCSLQPLSWQFKAKYCIDDTKRENMKFLDEDRDDYQTSDEDVDTATFAGTPNMMFGGAGPVKTNFRIAPPVAPVRTGGVVGPPKGKKKTTKKIQIHDPTLPIYWVEVFDVVNQSWITIDPLGAGIIRPLTNLEPPQWDWENEMSYVIAFDNDNYVRDITRKYVKAYNSYTRSLRVEATLDGEKWWKKALELYNLPTFLAPDRDQFEDGLMNDRVLREGIPKSLAAMKNHPVFAIEEQLRQNEVIHPKNACGTMAGKNKKPTPVYRRQDVKQVKSATQWYMLGREIKAGEQPLKHKKARKARRAPDPDDMDLDEMEDMDEMDTGMYAHFQTITYQPEPCIGPVVPKNAYGNIDLYVPSMLPEGGVHIPHKLARVAANFLGLERFVADAVTGFDFRNGGKSTPVINGIVAGVECEEGIWEMIEYIEKEQEEEADEVRRLTALNLWRKFLVGLRIKERVDEYAMDDEEAVVEEEGLEEEEEEDSYPSRTVDPAESGGFMVDQHESMTSVADSNIGDGGFFTNDLEDVAGELMRNNTKLAREKEEGRLLEEARARRAKLTEIELQKVETGEYYDPDAFEGGGGFFVEDTIVEEPKVDKGKGRALDSYIFTGEGGFFPEEPTVIEGEGMGGGFLVEESEMDLVSTSTANIGKRKRDSTEDLGGGFMVDEADVDTNARQNNEQPPQGLLEGEKEEEEDKSMEENIGDGDGDDDDDDIGDDFEYEDAGWTSD
ncbi:hypothetical protein TWF970_005256 [Orbilia oligospora]|uniref:DNA repair protein rad4 n=1 Tax=Orbilia oligospora TaxID=2813651 RepID=A0A7C8VFP1_ORBOL|nr:hypothetical protein TWF970_005256 [Orbilia oligospora]